MITETWFYGKSLPWPLDLLKCIGNVRNAGGLTNDFDALIKKRTALYDREVVFCIAADPSRVDEIGRKAKFYDPNCVIEKVMKPLLESLREGDKHKME